MGIRGRVTAAYRLLGSRRLSFWILGAGAALLLVWILPFELTGQPEATVESIGSAWAPMRAVYGAVAVATLACTVPRLLRDLARARRWRSGRARLSDDAPILKVALDEAERELSKAGYRTFQEPATVRAVKNAFAPLGGSIAHLALLALAAGLLVNAAAVTNTTTRVTEGQVFTDGALKGDSIDEAVNRRLEGIRLERITPGYFRDMLLFERLDATVLESGRVNTFSLAQPMWLDPITHLSVQDFGFAPRFRVDQRGRTIQDSTIAMSIFPPGSEDSAHLQSTGWTVSAVAYPDYARRGGRDVTMSYNLRNPRLLVSLADPSGEVLARRLIAPGESLASRGTTVTLVGVSRYGTFRLTRSAGLPIIVLALVGLVGGLTWRLLLRRHDVIVWQSGGVVRYDAWLDMEGRTAGRRALENLVQGVS